METVHEGNPQVRIRNAGAGLVFASLLLSTTSLFGASRTVSNAATLLGALNDLKSEGDVIYLDQGVYDLTDCEMSYNSHPYYHLVAENVKLVGNTGNARDVVLAGNGTHVIIYANGSSLENLTISNGCRQAGWTSEYSAGLYSKGTVVHSNIVVTSCRNLETGAGGIGGGGKFYDCLVCNNSTVKAGGGTLGGTFYNCVISNNTSTTDGGGCYWGVVLHDCQVLGNTSSTYGGGLSGNSSDASGFCHVYGGIVAGNSARDGGGAANTCFHGDTVVSNNTATSYGGGLYGTAGRHFASNTVFACNTAASGGGVYGCSIYGGRIAGNVATNGGGAWDSDIQGGGTVIQGNSASDTGGGVRLVNQSVSGALVYENEARNSGGGFYLKPGTSIFSCVVSNNQAYSTSGSVWGGGVYAEDTTALVRDSRIVFNCVSTGSESKNVGGAGIAYGCASNCLIAGNAIVDRVSKSSRLGAGAYGSRLEDCIVRDNFSTARNGIGQYYGKAVRCTFSNNLSTDTVANGVYSLSSCVECTFSGTLVSGGGYDRCKFLNSKSEYELADGANVYTSGTFKIAARPFMGKNFAATNCLFAANRSSTALFYIDSSTGGSVNLVNCTIASNRLERMFYARDNPYTCRAVNCLFVGNKTPDGASDLNMYLSETGNRVYLENCILGETTTGWKPRAAYSYDNVRTNNLFRFLGGEKDPYQLPRRSPAIGWGAVQDWMSDATDIRGEDYPRLRGGAVDIGCYQCWLPTLGMMLQFR